jgi:hypothetical protein
VALGLTSQINLDFEVEKAAKSSPQREVSEQPVGATLLPADQTTTAAAALAAAAQRPTQSPEREAEREADAVFAKLKSMNRKEDQEEE